MDKIHYSCEPSIVWYVIWVVTIMIMVFFYIIIMSITLYSYKNRALFVIREFCVYEFVIISFFH